MPHLSAPTQAFFLISLVLVVLAVLAIFVTVPFVSGYAFWFAVVGYAVLAAGCLFRGM
jgi:hypothetical protein